MEIEDWDFGRAVALRGLPKSGETGRTFPYLNANEAAKGIMNYFNLIEYL